MTREAAKHVLESLDYYLQNRFEDYGERNHDAMMIAIKALEQESVLDKIREEIEQNAYPIVHGVNNRENGMTLYGILQIIDKYRESEG